MRAVSSLTVPPVAPADPETLAHEILEILTYRIGKNASVATQHDWLHATIHVVRDRVVERWIDSTKRAYASGAKRVYYLSMEFLIGRLMRDAFSNLGMLDAIREALTQLGVELDLIAALEPDPALGNGGLGRLAACFMDIDGLGGHPGPRLRHPLCPRSLPPGDPGRWQVELPETWLSHGNPWEFERREREIEVGFGGHVESVTDRYGRLERHVWKPQERVMAVAYDTPVVGWRGKRVNTLRLWAAMPSTPSCSPPSMRRPYRRACREQQGGGADPRSLSGRFAPGGAGAAAAPGVFLLRRVAAGHPASPHARVRRPRLASGQGGDPPERHHPAIAVPELMRLLMDVHGIDLRQGVGHHAADLRLHQPHAASGSAGELAGPAVRAASAAPHADRLRDQRRGAARGAQDEGSERGDDPLDLADPRGRRAAHRMGNLAFVGSIRSTASRHCIRT